MSATTDFSEFFQPVDPERISGGRKYAETHFGQLISCHTAETGWPALDEIKIAFIGVNEDRRVIQNHGCALAPDAVRENLYRLFQGEWKLKMADLGDIRA